jgi:hypothetical protein
MVKSQNGRTANGQNRKGHDAPQAVKLGKVRDGWFGNIDFGSLFRRLENNEEERKSAGLIRGKVFFLSSSCNEFYYTNVLILRVRSICVVLV